jgi:hypothetical protein
MAMRRGSTAGRLDPMTANDPLQTLNPKRPHGAF